MAYEGPRSYRPVIMGRRGAVASNHPLASQAGLLALQAGGHAVDAAVAIAATLAVVEPQMSGLGGDGFYHVYDALNLESRFAPEVRAELAARGHRVVTLGELDGPCSVEIILRDAASGMLRAGSDPRRDGWALAY